MCWYQPKCISEYLAHERCLSYFFHHLELSSVYENKFLFVFFFVAKCPVMIQELSLCFLEHVFSHWHVSRNMCSPHGAAYVRGILHGAFPLSGLSLWREKLDSFWVSVCKIFLSFFIASPLAWSFINIYPLLIQLLSGIDSAPAVLVHLVLCPSDVDGIAYRVISDTLK